jgi:hypothetical protein
LYKIINLLSSSGKQQFAWINQNLDKVWDREARKRIEIITSAGENVAEYLYVSGRCAVAHAGIDPTVDPENLEDSRRLRLDRPLIKNLAEIAIEQHFGIQTPHTVWKEHKYELEGFRSLFGSAFVKKMKWKKSEFRRKVPNLPHLNLRLREREPFLPLENMSPITVSAADGVVLLECISPSGLVALYLALDFPDEKLYFDPIHGLAGQDDGSSLAAEEAAEIQRFLAHYFANGQLEIWIDPEHLISRCLPFIPMNVDLAGTLENFRKAEEQCRSIASARREESAAQQGAAADRPQPGGC